ncbi:hypothetical protein A2U01_0068729, partial [Trifolium medium]|nr:hypothetical protein [Trifolium medium]
NQGGTFQTNTQTTLDEKDNILPKNDECVEEDVEKNEEERIVEIGGVVKVIEENQAPHQEELPQELPCTEETNTVDNDEVMRVVEENEGLLDKEKSYEQKKEMENK